MVRMWIATFNPGRTYGLYVSHIRKADLMLGNEPTLRNTEIRTIANGLAGAQDRSYAFSNFTQSIDLFKILARASNRSALDRSA